MNTPAARFAWIGSVVVLLVACRSQQRLRDAQLMAECEGHTCVVLEQSDDNSAAFDVEAEYFPTMDDLYVACHVTMRRPSASPTLGMRYSPLVFQGKVFPLDGGIAKVQRCYTEYDARYHEQRARMVYLVSPPGYESLAPVAGNVVVPFDNNSDQLSLAGGLGGYAQAEEDTRRLPLRDRVTLVTTDSSGTGETVHDGLHAGDAFSWGSRTAQVVRIVLPERGVIGWVEVVFR